MNYNSKSMCMDIIILHHLYCFLREATRGMATSRIWSSFFTNWECAGQEGGFSKDPTRDLKETNSSSKARGGSESGEAIGAGNETTQKEGCSGELGFTGCEYSGFIILVIDNWVPILQLQVKKRDEGLHNLYC
jgi:hypothetical protein